MNVLHSPQATLQPSTDLYLHQEVQINSRCRSPKLIGEYGTIVGFQNDHPRVELTNGRIWVLAPEIVSPVST